MAAPSADAEGLTHLHEIIAKGATRGDPGDMARRLIDAFGTFGAVLAASPGQLLRIVGGERAAVREITAFRRAMTVALRSRIEVGPVLATSKALTEYLRDASAWLTYEQVRVLHLDAGHALLRDEIVGQGTVDEVPFYPREILRRAIELGSSALILSHNHPSGDPRPSSADIQITRNISAACALFRIELIDHIIVSARGTFVSFRAMQLL